MTSLAVAITLALGSVAVARPPVPASRLVVWPRDPSVGDAELATATAAVAGSNHAAIAFDGDRLRAAGVEATRGEARALDAVQAAFAAARAAYLRQDFAAMADTLAGAEAAALEVLAEPRHVAVLWELEFQRGLAELSRGSSPRAYFDLALALDATRAPRRELYGPAVARAFTEAIDGQAAVPPRPIAIRIQPGDARVVVDGLPIVDPAAPRTLRPGRHVVLASAPGFATTAVVVELATGQPIELALAPVAGDTVTRIGATWARGTLDPATESGRRAILEVARASGASGALVISIDRTRGDATARLVLAEDLRTARGSTIAAAVRAVLGDDVVGPRVPDPRDTGSRWRSPWLWAAVGAVAIAGTGAVFFATRAGDDTIRILPPR